MSLLYKRPDSPYYYVTKTRESTKTVNRKRAEEFASKSLAKHWREKDLGESVKLWKDVAEDWLDAKEGQASHDQDRMVIAKFSDHLARRDITAVGEITAECVQEYVKVVKAVRSASTANRHLTTIRAIVRNAMGVKAPAMKCYKLTPKEPNWLTIEQFNTILPHLPEWVADMAVIAVQTGMRYSNVAGLKWEWIRGNIVTVPALHTKTAKTYTVPLSEKAKEVLARLAAIKADPVYVFVGEQRKRSDKPWNDTVARRREVCLGVERVAPIPKNCVHYHWEKARNKAGFPNIRWQDLRHTWASLHTQNGTPDRILAKMGGWASTRMLENYAHLSTEHLVEYANNIG